MPLIVAKLFSDDSVTDLNAAIDAYKAGAGAELLTSQRAMAADDFEEPDGDMRMAVLLCHGGQDVPASGAKIGDLQHVNVVKQGDLSELQAAIDEALSNVVHQTVADGDLNTTPNDIISATGPFAAEDVGRKVLINGEERTITAHTSANQVTYDGAALTGTGATVSLLGCEIVQDARLEMQKRATDFRMHLLLACEGELAQ